MKNVELDDDVISAIVLVTKELGEAPESMLVQEFGPESVVVDKDVVNAVRGVSCLVKGTRKQWRD